MALIERGIVLRRSRASYFYNYVLIALVLTFLALVWAEYNLTFTLFPRNFSEFSKTLVVFCFVALTALLLEEPAVYQWFVKYIITNNEVIKSEGVIRKKRTVIPHQSIANVHVYKGVLGRILDFGDVNVVGFKNEINMRGIREPETFYRVINNKIALMRGTAPKTAALEESDTRERVESIDWRKEQKFLDKKVQPFDTVPKRAATYSRGKRKIGISGILKRRRTEETELEELTKEEQEDSTEENKTKRKKQRKKKRAKKKR